MDINQIIVALVAPDKLVQYAAVIAALYMIFRKVLKWGKNIEIQHQQIEQLQTTITALEVDRDRCEQNLNNVLTMLATTQTLVVNKDAEILLLKNQNQIQAQEIIVLRADNYAQSVEIDSLKRDMAELKKASSANSNELRRLSTGELGNAKR